MAQGLMDDFLVYKWQYMEDKKQTFIKSLESYLQNVRQKIFARSQDAEDHFVEAVAFLQQPLPDIKGQGSDQCRQDLEERVKFLEKKSEIHKQQVEDIEKKHQEEMEKMEEKMKEQERMTSEQKEEMEKMEDKMKEQERRSASSADELKNSFSDLQRNMEEESNKLEKLKRETDEDSKKRNRQIKEMKSNLKTLEDNANDTTKSLRVSEKVTADLKVSVMKLDAQHQTEADQQNDKIDKLRKEIEENTEKSRKQMKYLKTSHKTVMRVCSERLASVGEIMKTVIQLHTATGTPFPTHAVAGPSSGVTTQATPTQAVAGPSSGVTTQATSTHAVASPSSGVTTQATPTQAVASPSSGVTTQATPTQAVAGPSSGVTTQATSTHAVASPSSGVTTQATPTQAVASPSSGETTQAIQTQAVASPSSGVTTQATPTHAVASPSSGVTTQATPTQAVAGPSSGVTTQATSTHAVASPSSGVTTQATPTQAVASPSSGVTTQATPTQAVAGPSSGVTTQATSTHAVASPSSGVTTQATPTQAVASPSSGVTTQATQTQAVACPSSGVTTQATPTQAVASPYSGVTTQATLPQTTAASPGLSASAALTTSPGQDRTPTAVKLLNTLNLDVSICDLLLLADGMLLVATYSPYKLMLYDLSGTQLQTMSMNGACRLCKDGDGCVFVIDRGNSQMKCLNVERKDIKVKATYGLSNEKNYYAITALDKTLAVSHFEGVDLINTNGTVLKTFAIDSTVYFMCTLPGGDLICCDQDFVISRWNPTTGKRLFQTEVPEIPHPWGVASLPSRTILVGGGCQGTLSLIDERGKFIRDLYKSPSGEGVHRVSVQDNKCVLQIPGNKDGTWSVQVIKLVY